ncbi:MAG: efflux RND transporter periplasmic adaptor subunit [Pirellulaceae bacterium]
MKYWRERNKPIWETKQVIRGDATENVTATGTVKPVLSVSVGAFVSGPIIELKVDFNDEVEKDQLLARVDPRLYKAAVARDEAALASRQAEVLRVKAQLQQAKNNKLRGERLRAKNADFLSDREMDALRFDVEGLEAQLELANASVLQATAGLETSQANLQYTEIRSPVDGVVIDRKIDEGQTLAAQFQTPELFIIAPDLQKKVHVFASVAEKEIGVIQKAQDEKRPVTFTVDAHPNRLFTGEIEQIRVSSNEVQGVVTYPVVIAAANEDRKLLPGMTATISFEVASKTDAIKVPNDALRFYPQELQFVREEDRKLLDASRWKSTEETSDDSQLSAEEKVDSQNEKNKRHVWIQHGDFLKAVEIVTGIVESRFTVLESGELKEGDALVINRKRK